MPSRSLTSIVNLKSFLISYLALQVVGAATVCQASSVSSHVWEGDWYKDEAIARDLQQQEDEAFARRLQQGDNSGGLISLTRGLANEEKTFIKELLVKVKVFPQNSDVHEFNAAFKNDIQRFMAITAATLAPQEDSLLPLNLSVLGAFVLDFHDASKKESAQKVINIIRETSPKTPVDSETGLDVPKLLSMLIDVGMKYVEVLEEQIRREDSVGDTKTLKSLNYQTSEEAVWGPVVRSLAENIETQGGCYPGIAGRLFLQYMRLSISYLEMDRRLAL